MPPLSRALDRVAVGFNGIVAAMGSSPDQRAWIRLVKPAALSLLGLMVLLAQKTGTGLERAGRDQRGAVQSGLGSLLACRRRTNDESAALANCWVTRSTSSEVVSSRCDEAAIRDAHTRRKLKSAQVALNFRSQTLWPG